MEQAINGVVPEVVIFDRKMREAKSYWLEKLSRDIGESGLRPDYERPEHFSAERHAIDFSVDGELYQSLCKVTGSKPFLMYAALMAALKVCLYKYTGAASIVVGSPSLREESGAASHPNALAILDDVDARHPFKQLLLNVRQTLLDGYTRQAYPFGRMVKDLEQDAWQNRCPLFDVALELREIHHPLPEVRNDLTLSFAQQDGMLRGHAYFNPGLFRPESVERFIEHFKNVLRGALANPAAPLGELSVLGEDERHRLLVEWNPRAGARLEGRCLHEVFEEQAARTPDALALMLEDESLSYAELNERANQLAHRLRRLGVEPESRVGVCLRRSAEAVVALLGVLKAGGVYVPLDPAYPSERLAYMMEDAGVSVVLTQEQLSDALPEDAGRVLRLDADRDAVLGESRTNPDGGAQSANLAYVIYTSGSTGRPKGVCISHEAAANHFAAVRQTFGLTPQDRVLQFASLSFDVSLEQVFAPLFSGACVVLRGEEMWDAQDLVKRIVNLGLTVVNVPPAYWNQFAADAGADSYGRLRLIIVGGDVLSPESLRAWRRSGLGGLRLLNAYGPTEAVITSTVYDIPPDLSADRHLKRVPIGRPVGSRSIYILDRDNRPTPVGVAGRLHIGGDLLARGYLGRPGLTAERFVPDPFSSEPGTRLYDTGDLAYYLPDGDIEFLGRADNQVKLRGFRIELGEVESLLESHPGLRECAVVVREDEPGDKRIVAYVVPQQAAPAATPESNGHGTGKRGKGLELWPSIGEYSVYDELTYYVMTNDELKVNKYNAAVNKMVLGKTVLDLGTGKDAILARMCAHAGAKTVYALEVLDESYRLAQETVGKLNLEDRIILLKGDSLTAELPEKVDVCITEVFCSIGGAGGAGVLINDARRFLKDGGKIIPRRSLTHIAAVRLPDELLDNLGFTDVSAHYIEKIFDEVGHRFDLRLCIDRFPVSHVASDFGVFEDLDFTEPVEPSFRREVTLTVESDGKIDGFLLWLNLETTDGEVIDTLAQEYGWMPTYFPAFHPAIRVSKGDTISLVCEGTLCEDRLHPDYRIEGHLLRRDGQRVEFAYDSFHHRPGHRKNWFYEQLFPEDSLRIISAEAADVSPESVRRYLGRHLPEHMLPSHFVTLDALPLLPNGKIDRRALPAPERDVAHDEKTASAPGTPVQEVLAGIWAELLGLTEVGRDDNFFDLGGHSLKATQAMSRVRDIFHVDLPLRIIFDTHDLAGLAAVIEESMHAGRAPTAPPLVPAAREGALPLSFAQQRLWFLDRLQPGSPFYNIPAAVRLTGRLNVGALGRTLSEIARRHESLRTTFGTVGGDPVQVIAPPTELPMPLTDLSHLPRPEREATALRLAAEEARLPFDLANEPAVRVGLLQLDTDEHILLFTMHHIICDGWSMGVLIQEVATLYEAFTQEQPSPLRELALQYADFAHWQRSWLRGEVLDAQLSYWKKQLASAPPVLELPLDRPRPAMQTFRGAGEAFRLSHGVTEALKALGRREGTTLFMTLLAAFKLLLHRHSGQQTIVVGSPIANRNRAETESLIGLFVNTLVLRTELGGNPTFKELLVRVREVTLGAYAHQDLPFEKLVEELQPERSLSRSPLFQVMFVLQNAPRDVLQLPGVSLSLLPSEGGTAKFELLLSLTESPEGLVGALEYNTDLFEAATVKRLLGHYERLLEGIAADADQRVLDLPLMTEEERAQTLAGWNDTRRDYRRDVCLHQLFAEQAARTPEAVALVSEAGALTYRELDERANQLAHYLRRRFSVGPERRVGVCVERSPEMLAGLLGILKAGGAYVPLDPAYPQERLSFMLADSQVCAVLTEQAASEKLLPGTPGVIYLDRDREEIERESRRAPEGGAAPGNLAYVIYTSGSTGRPKGVAIEHASAATLVQWAGEVFSPADLSGVLASTSICFDLSVFELFVPLSYGGKVVLAENALHLPALAARNEVSLVNTVPSAMAELLRTDGLPPTVRVVNLAGETFQSRLIAELYERPGVERVYNLYGPSEDTTYTTCELLPSDGGPITIGRPIADTQIYLLDERLEPVAVGVVGELYIGGRGLCRGYLGRPGLTAERFVPNSFDSETGTRLYRTGDLARYRNDGRIEFLGRADRQVKLRGYRIELSEVEAAALDQPGVRECVVVERGGPEGEKRLEAFVVLEPGSPVTAGELRGLLRHRLPAYMIPSAFVELERMPLTPNGKVDFNSLPRPEGVRPELRETYVAPQTGLEQAVASVWQEALGLDRVGVHDNFFDLGGHSLLLVRVINQLREVLGRELPIIHMFEYPTVSALARFLAEGEDEETYFAEVGTQAARQRAARQQRQQVRERVE